MVITRSKLQRQKSMCHVCVYYTGAVKHQQAMRDTTASGTSILYRLWTGGEFMMPDIERHDQTTRGGGRYALYLLNMANLVKVSEIWPGLYIYDIWHALTASWGCAYKTCIFGLLGGGFWPKGQKFNSSE